MKIKRKHPAHKHLKKLQGVKRKHYHPLIHKIHKEHGISKKTLFYIKEYGPHSHIPKRIMRESIFILILASLISSFGGFSLENIKNLFVSIFPLIVILPVLNDMIGNYGTVISSKFSTFLHEGKIKREWWKSFEIKKLFLQIVLIALITALLASSMSLAIAGLSEYNITSSIIGKFIFLIIVDVLILTTILFFIAIFCGIYIFKKGEDPNNFLIPITTSIADFSNMIILSILVILFF
ncbi:MAG: magnesium transporter [Candidatus Aenigmatarchaeota archaeon]